MKTSTLLALTALTAGALYFLTRKNKDKSVKIAEELGLKKNKTSRKNLTKKEQNSINGLNFGLPISINEKKVKAPIYIPSENLIPDVYGRSVGQVVNFEGSSGYYSNMSGNATVSITDACKCAPKSPAYKLDIPKLP